MAVSSYKRQFGDQKSVRPPMSALDQKKTYAVHNGMSALPSNCPLRANSGHPAMRIMQLVANEKAGQKIFAQRYTGS
jgi:hypothetical protein